MDGLLQMLRELLQLYAAEKLMALAKPKLLIIDELGFVPLSKTGAELLFEVFSQRYERGATLVTSNLPFDEWTEIFGSERLTGALLDRLTHHCHIVETGNESWRFKHSQAVSLKGKQSKTKGGKSTEQLNLSTTE